MTAFCRPNRSTPSATFTAAFTLRLITPLIGLMIFGVVLLATPLKLLAAPEAQKPADIRVLIDVSGSMKQNDPRNLRRPAMDMLVQLFPAESRAGVWTFGKYVNMLVPHDDVNGSWRDSAARQSRLVNSVALHTNIGLALEKANYDSNVKDYPASENFNKSVILLTDGVVDLSKDTAANEQERERILNEILPAYQAAGIAIHAIALSTNADVELLERLSIETDGIFAVAEDAEALDRIFLRAFDQSAQGDRTPLEDNRFLIDSSVEEFTALVFKKPGSDATQIQSPDGQVYSAQSDGASVRWFSSEAYDLITIAQPVEGEWKINAEMDPENRVTVVSNLSLAIDAIDNNLYHGSTAELKASLMESDQPVSRDEFLDILTVDAQMSRGYTKFWQQRLPRDFDAPGIYSRKLDMLRNSGDYALTVVVDGKTFKREKTIKFTVRDPLRVELAANEAQGEYTLTVMADDKRLRTDSVEVFSEITQPDGSVIEQSLTQTSPGVWSYQASEQVTGEYIFSITARGTNTEGVSVERDAGEHSLYLNVPGVPEPVREPEPVVIPEPEPEPVVPEVVEPEPVAEVAPAPAAAPVEEAPAEAEPEPSNLMLYGGLAGGNLLLIGLLYFAYRKMFGGKPPEDDAEEQTGESKAEADPVEEALEESPAEEAVEEEAEEELEVVAEVETVEEADAEEADIEEALTEAAEGDAAIDELFDEVEASDSDALEPIAEKSEASDEIDDLMAELEGDATSEDLAAVATEAAPVEAEDDGLDIIEEQTPVEEAVAVEPEPEPIDLDAMLDVDEDAAADVMDADDIDVNLESDVPADDDLKEDIDAILAEIDEGSESTAAAEPVAEEPTEDLDGDDITLDLDGEFDLSSDISDEEPPQQKKSGQ